MDDTREVPGVNLLPVNALTVLRKELSFSVIIKDNGRLLIKSRRFIIELVSINLVPDERLRRYPGITA